MTCARLNQAEIDDLTQDSEGEGCAASGWPKAFGDRLLVKMMELAPEMVAVVFHQGFRFTRAAPLEQALAVGQDHLPSWESLSTCVSLSSGSSAARRCLQSQVATVS